MKKFIFTIAVIGIAMVARGEENIPDDIVNSLLDGPCENHVDINVDEANREVTLIFNETAEVQTVVTGPDGVEFYDEINGQHGTQFVIPLHGGEGDYNVMLVDGNGDLAEAAIYIP